MCSACCIYTKVKSVYACRGLLRTREVCLHTFFSLFRQWESSRCGLRMCTTATGLIVKYKVYTWATIVRFLVKVTTDLIHFTSSQQQMLKGNFGQVLLPINDNRSAHGDVTAAVRGVLAD